MGEKFMNGCEVCAGLVHLNVNASIYAPLCGVNQLQYSMLWYGRGGRGGSTTLQKMDNSIYIYILHLISLMLIFCSDETMQKYGSVICYILNKTEMQSWNDYLVIFFIDALIRTTRPEVSKADPQRTKR